MAENQLLYERLVDDIKAHIKRCNLSSGDRLPSMAEIGEQFGVSNVTVRAAVAKLTDEGVIESRHRKGLFVKEAEERALPLDGKKTIGVLVPNCEKSYESGIISGVVKELQANGYRAIIANSGGKAEHETEQLLELAGQVGGLIVFPTWPANNYSAYTTLLERNIPWVFVDRCLSGLAAPLVATDNEHGGYLATRHLLEMGCQHVYAINPELLSSTQERLQGHQRALKEWGITNPQSYMHTSPIRTNMVGYTFTQEILKNRRDGEKIGIFTTNEIVARTCYNALREAGVQIPEEIAVASYDDFAAVFFDPPLTAVPQDPNRMGVMAAKVLLDKMQNKKVSLQEVRLKPELKVRESSDASKRFSWSMHQNELVEHPLLPNQEIEKQSGFAKTPVATRVK